MKRAAVVVSALGLALSVGAPSSFAGRSSGASNSSSAWTAWCDPLTPVPPCIESATRGGAPVDESDEVWGLSLLESSGVAKEFFWNVIKKDADDLFDLGTGALVDEWVIRFNTGADVPRVAFARARSLTVTRTSSGPHRIEISAKPAPISDHPVPLEDPNQCDTSTPVWTCPPQATKDRVMLGGTVSDFGQWTPVDQRVAIYGMDWATNIDAVAIPPTLRHDAAGVPLLEFQVANSHQRKDGSVFQGFKHVRIPSGFLQAAYGIDDPESLTTGGVIVGGAGPSASTSVAIDGGSVVVAIEGMTFSQRLVRVRRGVITPTKPTNVRAVRSAPKRGRVRFAPARPRGSKITRYQARCVAPGSVVRSVGKRSPLVVKGLQPGTRYQCRVRARAKAGFGAWSKGVRMPARA